MIYFSQNISINNYYLFILNKNKESPSIFSVQTTEQNDSSLRNIIIDAPPNYKDAQKSRVTLEKTPPSYEYLQSNSRFKKY